MTNTDLLELSLEIEYDGAKLRAYCRDLQRAAEAVVEHENETDPHEEKCDCAYCDLKRLVAPGSVGADRPEKKRKHSSIEKGERPSGGQ